MIKEKKKKLSSIIGIGIMTILLSYVSTYDPSSLSFFSPAEKSVDFQSSDFYQLVANLRNVRFLDNQIVIVPIDTLSRLDIALLIEDISLCNPTAIGLDVNFPFSSEADSLLKTIITKTPSIILPIGLDESMKSQHEWICLKSHFLDELSISQRGVVNLNINHPYSVVRSFIPFYNTDRGTVSNFVTSLAMLTDNSNTIKEELLKRPEIEIDYSCREFNIIEPSNVLLNINDIENKIILLGAISDTQDMHITPISDATPGVLIHANALSTILNRGYFKHLPTLLSWLFSLLLSAIFVVAYTFFSRFQAGNMFMRIFQILLLFLIIFFGCTLFIKYHLVLELSLPLMLATLGIVAIDFWKGLLWIYQGLCVLNSKLGKKWNKKN